MRKKKLEDNQNNKYNTHKFIPCEQLMSSSQEM